MANYLGLSWDQNGLYLIEGHVKGASLTWGASLFFPVPFDPGAAEGVGLQLKQRLKDQGIKPYPLLISLGRDRFLTKELRYPDVAPDELPSLIQFQTYKDLAFSPEEAVIDFQPVSIPWSTGEKRAISLIARQSDIHAFNRLSQAAGLKIESILPHGFAVLANALTFIPPHAAATGVIADGEFLVVYQREIIYSRSLDLDENLSREVKRNVAAFQTQFPQLPIQEVFVAGADLTPALEKLVESLHKPIRWYDPGAGMQVNLEGSVSQWLPALGAVQAKQIWPKLPVDFAAPKKDVPKPNRKRFYAIVGGSLAAGLGLLGGAFYLFNSLEKEAKIKELQDHISQLNTNIAGYGNVEERLADIRRWQDHNLVLMDELYDLSAWFPDVPGVRITKAQWSTVSQTPAGVTPRAPQPPRPPTVGALGSGPASPALRAPLGASAAPKPVAEVSLTIQAESADRLAVLRRQLDMERNWKIDAWHIPLDNDKEVTARLKIFARKPSDYKATITKGTHVSQPGEIQSDNNRGRGTNIRTNRGGRP